MASAHAPSVWEHAPGPSADPRQGPFPAPRHSGGQGASCTRQGLDPFAHGLQMFLSKLLSRLLGRIKFIVFNQNNAECLGFLSQFWEGPRVPV